MTISYSLEVPWDGEGENGTVPSSTPIDDDLTDDETISPGLVLFANRTWPLKGKKRSDLESYGP